MANNRLEQFKPGGGEPKILHLTGIEENIILMLPSSIEGLPSVWDSDQPDQPNISIYHFIRVIQKYILSYLS